MSEGIKLTQYSHGSGCGCKIAPAVLENILKQSGTNIRMNELLVGYESKDDAAVYRLHNDTCLISTVDFFTPVVDDPYLFGRIAAANALSDVYAMGGDPLLAIAILGWPVDKLPAELAAKVLEGGRDACKEVGIPLAGGHSIDSPEPFFGLAVNGLVTEKNILRNNTASEGDFLFLTKPIGSGILSAAMKRGKLLAEHEAVLIQNLTTINKIGSKLSNISEVHAVTDVTGFGLLGHLIEITEGSGLSSVLEYSTIPLLDGAAKYASEFIFPDNTYRNWNGYEKKVSGVDGPSFITLSDPQTNGGLLISIAENGLPELKKLLEEYTPSIPFVSIGRIIAKDKFEVLVK